MQYIIRIDHKLLHSAIADQIQSYILQNVDKNAVLTPDPLIYCTNSMDALHDIQRFFHVNNIEHSVIEDTDIEKLPDEFANLSQTVGEYFATLKMMQKLKTLKLL